MDSNSGHLPPQPADNTEFYSCECTSCRNQGNSVDICCQCCTCLEQQRNHRHHHNNHRQGRDYDVNLTGESDDTLRVCINDYEDEIEQEDEELEDEDEEEELCCPECQPQVVNPSFDRDKEAANVNGKARIEKGSKAIVGQS